MKITRLLTRMLFMLAVAASIPQQARAAFNQILYTANYNGTPVLGTDTLGGVTYSTVTYGDLYNGGDPGMPYLPVDYIRFSVPYNATNFTVTATWSNMYNTNYNLSHLVYPSQPPRLMNDTTPIIITLPDTSAYFLGGTYPSQLARVVDEGFLDGENHIVTVAVMPFGYTHTANTDKVSLHKRVNLKLRYDLSDSLAMYPIIRNDSALREEGYALARSMVVNPGQVKTFAPVALQFDFDSIGINPNGLTGDGLNGGVWPGFDPPDPSIIDTTQLGYDVMHMTDIRYLIVTTADLYQSMRRLAALKRQKGYTVGVVTMNQVMNDSVARFGDRIKKSDGIYHVVDSGSAGVLRQFLRNCYCKCGTRFVLLVGKGIPYKTIPNTYVNPHPEYDLISDLYFSDLNADWDSIQKIDIKPELYVGRIVCDNNSQIDNYTDKLFRYELNPGNGDVSYLRNAFFSEGRDFRGRLSNAKKELESVYPEPIIINDSLNNNSRHPRGKEIIDTLNVNQVGFACIFNHGDSAQITVYGKDSIGYRYYIEAYSPINKGYGLNCLTNKQYPMIFYAPSCSTIPFDYTGGMSFGESFTTGKDYGGPVYIGYTRTILDYRMQPILDLFAQKINQGYYQLGVADALSKGAGADVWFSIYNEKMAHAYLGDPSLELWTNEPQQFNGVSLSRTNNSITVSGLTADSSIVAFFHNDGSRRIMTATTDSLTFHNVSPNGVVMLYKHNYLPYIAPMSIQNVELKKSQYVIAGDVIAGNSIDSIRTPGDVAIKNGIQYEIEASGTVTLLDGFKVERGATFAVYPSRF